ncbi:hypothetical protein AKJ16_DCAP13081 [Drosera capensis]
MNLLSGLAYTQKSHRIGLHQNIYSCDDVEFGRLLADEKELASGSWFLRSKTDKPFCLYKFIRPLFNSAII